MWPNVFHISVILVLYWISEGNFILKYTETWLKGDDRDKIGITGTVSPGYDIVYNARPGRVGGVAFNSLSSGSKGEEVGRECR